jgi:DNA invertase Pin-like site-specific DNA recombinase
MKVIGYARVSTDEQGASGLGLEAQTAKLRAYCDLYGHEMVEVVTEAASGKNLRRHGLQSVLDALRAGKAAGLLIAKLDRLTRSVRDMGDLLEQHFSGNAHLLVVAEQVDTSSAGGRLVLNVLMSVAQWEREAIGERTKDALKAKRSRGEKTGGGIPFGFDVLAGKLVENPAEQRGLRLIESLRAKGHGYHRIANQMNADGILTKTGRAWTPPVVRQVYLRSISEAA